ncbi:MAG: fused MFS/spermidine synthase [Betaproteobacteria bacterium]
MHYALVIFISAFLIFLVQPLIAKQILPWFGGSAAVWATCLLFFQTALLAGYAYADAVTRWLSLKRQVMLHMALLTLAALTMPILVSEAWRPVGTEEPISRILLLLAATIGLPYFLLATTTPLVGAWYSRRFHAAAPYRLFALSNFASLLALLGFPFLIEPMMGNRQVSWAWSGLFVVFALLCAALAWRTLKASTASVGQAAGQVGPGDESAPGNTSGAGAAASAGAGEGAAAGPLTWTLLSAVGSAMLLGVTSHLTQNISSAPLLWVIPLALYLVTFIISFDHPRWYLRGLVLPLAGISLPLMAWLSDSLALKQVTPVYALGLFFVCMACHGELARLKPEPRRLTAFYLCMSVGGALGSLFMAVLAPLVFKGYFELYAALVVAGMAAWLLPLPAWASSRRLVLRAAVGAVVLCTGALSVQGVKTYVEAVRFMDRDFYGVVRTRDSDVGGEPFRNLIHGAIAHGGQLLREDLRMAPSSYFGPTSGYGRVFASLPPGPRKVGVIGLGAGALAAYAKPGDDWVFYEISPAVVQAALQEFTFLPKFPGRHEVVVGDGRLALEREAPRQYDVLAMDAFAGDSIPTHLITREAMAAYLKHLKPDGVLVFQATNRFVNLMPVLHNLAQAFGMQAVLISDSPPTATGADYWLSSTDQVIVTRNAALLQSPAIREVALPLQADPGLPVFTDDYVNLVRILKW